MNLQNMSLLRKRITTGCGHRCNIKYRLHFLMEGYLTLVLVELECIFIPDTILYSHTGRAGPSARTDGAQV